MATLQVKTCRFAEAEKGFDRALAEYEPLTRYVDRALADPATRRALAERLLSADELHPIDTHDTDGVIASMLEVDSRFYRLHALARGLAQGGGGRRPRRGRLEAARRARRQDQGAGGDRRQRRRAAALRAGQRARRRGRARAQGRGQERRGQEGAGRARGAARRARRPARAHARHGADGRRRRPHRPRRRWSTPIAPPPTNCAPAPPSWRGRSTPPRAS